MNNLPLYPEKEDFDQLPFADDPLMKWLYQVTYNFEQLHEELKDDC